MATNLEKEASTNSTNFELKTICWKVLLQVQLQILNQATHFFICCERVFSVARFMCTPKKLAGTMYVQIYVKRISWVQGPEIHGTISRWRSENKLLNQVLPRSADRTSGTGFPTVSASLRPTMEPGIIIRRTTMTLKVRL